MDSELDSLITYIENDLIGENPNMQLIDEGIKRYAEIWHKKMVEKEIEDYEKALKKVLVQSQREIIRAKIFALESLIKQ